MPSDNYKSQTQRSSNFWENTPIRASKRGHFWITGERIKKDDLTFQRGPMYVAWEAPEKVTQPYPIVLVHGGLLQATEWLDTPDGRPGWAQRLVEAGYVVLVVDRPGHGHSHTHPDIVGPVGQPFSYEDGKHVFFPPELAEQHTQWPIDLQDEAALDAFIAPFGPLPADLAESQDMDATRLAVLLDRIGPAIIMTHSASGPDGWLIADRRPELVKAIVTVEPMGPAFANIHGIGKLSWGLTAAAITYDPPFANPDEVERADPSSLQIPALKGIPIVIVTGGASAFAKPAPAIVNALNTAGAFAEQLHLPDHGVNGNGHGLIYELNSDEALAPVLKWLETHVGNTVNASAQSIDKQVQKATIHVTYSGNSAAKFDREYYVANHIPLVMESWGKYGLESATALFPANDDAGIVAVCICIFNSNEAIQAAFNSLEAAGVMADVKAFTNINPVRTQVLAF